MLPDSRSRSNNPASPRSTQAALAEMEPGTVGTMHAFRRWIVRCMEAAGRRELTAVDVLVLYHLNRRTHERRLANICAGWRAYTIRLRAQPHHFENGRG